MDPFAAAVSLLATLALIPIIGFGAVWIIQRMVAGDLAAVPGFLGLCALCGMFAVAILVPDQRMLGPVIVVLVVGMAFFPFAETQLEKYELDDVDNSRIDKAHRDLFMKGLMVCDRARIPSTKKYMDSKRLMYSWENILKKR